MRRTLVSGAQPHDLANRFNDRLAARLLSSTWERVYRTAFGDEYPDETDSNGYYSRTALQRLSVALKLTPGRMLVDLGCGHGGPGLWVAGQTGADLIGIDLSAVGVALARERADRMGLGGRAQFRVGNLMATELPEASCDAVLSLDVLLFVPDKAAAARECARILRTGGTLGFTTWEQPGYSERLGAEQVADYRPLLQAAGFVIETYEEPPEWRRQQRAVAEGLIAAEADMAREMPAETAAGLAAMGRGMLADMPARRYICVVARKM
jgi:ubiquinone/menaquinone biosynthesis C-methylase UbiE